MHLQRKGGAVRLGLRPVTQALTTTTNATRRQASTSLLLLPLTSFAIFTNSAAAAPAAPVGPVRPALPPRGYLDRIQEYRQPAFQQLGDLLDRSKFKEAAEALVLSPVDDIVQCAYYLPWAVLAVDEQRAIQVQQAYTVFEDKLFTFQSLCRQAASYRAEDEDVAAALTDMQAALDALVTAAA